MMAFFHMPYARMRSCTMSSFMCDGTQCFLLSVCLHSCIVITRHCSPVLYDFILVMHVYHVQVRTRLCSSLWYIRLLVLDGSLQTNPHRVLVLPSYVHVDSLLSLVPTRRSAISVSLTQRQQL